MSSNMEAWNCFKLMVSVAIASQPRAGVNVLKIGTVSGEASLLAILCLIPNTMGRALSKAAAHAAETLASGCGVHPAEFSIVNTDVQQISEIGAAAPALRSHFGSIVEIRVAQESALAGTGAAWNPNLHSSDMPVVNGRRPKMAIEGVDLRISLQRLLTVLVLTIVPLSMVGLFVTDRGDKALERTVGSHFKMIADSKAGQISQFINDVVIAMGGLAAAPVVKE